MTTIIGIDAATQAKKTGLALGRLEDGVVVIAEAVLGSEVPSVSEQVAAWIGGGPALVAVDAPLGWPVALGRGLGGHRAGDVLEGESGELFRRATDRFVHARLRKLPLEVGADRIARTAHAALRLLGELRDRTGLEIPLAWDANVQRVAAIEVYPAATLLSRKVVARGYKGAEGAATRRAILQALGGQWRLELDAVALGSCDDRLDAALCVLAGADFLRGHAVGPAGYERDAARVEGWIWFREPDPAPPNR